MQGHVIPSFPHTLISLGPFANLGCQIVFTKTAVSVIHLDGHSILKGWREQDGPRLWRFSLKANKPSLPVTALADKMRNRAHAEARPIFSHRPTSQACRWPRCLKIEPGPHGSAAIFFTPPLTSPIQCPTALLLPAPARLLTPAPPAQTHLSQRCLAIDKAGQACLVTYMYGAAQVMALAAQASNTTFDPQSLDLPSMGALVGFYHACLGFPVKQTWLDAIKAGNCVSFDGLTYSNVARYCLDADEIILGHFAQQRQNMQSTKPRSPAPEQVPPLPAIAPKHQISLPTKSTSRSSPSASSTRMTLEGSLSRPIWATNMS
jgi:hypothetical protein